MILPKDDFLYPYPHETMHDKFRVPVWKSDPDYIIYVAKNYKRTFNDNTLPNYIQAKLTMANASGNKYASDSEINYIDLFIYNGNDGMGDIAWRASDTMYIVILDGWQVSSLIGETDDTRS